MGYETVSNFLRTRFKNEVATPLSLVTVYDNQVDVDPAPIAESVRLAIQWGDQQQVSTGAPGSRRYRAVGIMQAGVRVPVGYGNKRSLEIVDAIMAAFRGLTFPEATLNVPYIAREGREGAWWETDVVIPFYTDFIA